MRPSDPDGYFEGSNRRFTRTLRGPALRLPGFRDARLGKGWAGLYPVSPDGRPHLGPCPEDRSVIAACGVGGYGIQVSPIAGRLAAEWIVFDEPRSMTEAMDFSGPPRTPRRHRGVTSSEPAGRYEHRWAASGDAYQEALRWLPGGNTRTQVFIPPFPVYARSARRNRHARRRHDGR